MEGETAQEGKGGYGRGRHGHIPTGKVLLPQGYYTRGVLA